MRGAPITIAFDRDSVRSYDRDGRLHVATTNISKAAINPYLGREIPDWEELGLDPERLYQLLRDPEEIEKAAPTFNNLPLLSRHVAVTADAHAPELVIGSTGTDAEFSAPYLRNSLVIWAKGGIDAVESEAQKELSSAYRYRADMTPGVFDGQKYDGVMRDIVGNHVAIVKEGRAGADVVVGDSNEELIKMSKRVLMSRAAILALGALSASVPPLLAQDQKIDLLPLVAGIKHFTDFKAKRPEIVAALTKALEGKLAKDASIEGVAKLLDALDKPAANDADKDDAVDPATIGLLPDEDDAMDADPMAKIMEFLTGKLSPEDLAQAKALCASPGAGDEPPAFPGKPVVGKGPGGAKDADPDKKDDEKKDDDDMVKKPAMDAAIKLAVDTATEDLTKRHVAIREAEKAVRPFVGELAIACDSADKVYEAALKVLGVETKGVHPSAFPTILAMQKKPGDKEPRVAIAQDAAGAKDFSARWGTTPSAIQVL